MILLQILYFKSHLLFELCKLNLKIYIDGKLKIYILTVFETKKGLLKYYIQENIKKSDRLHHSKSIKKSVSSIGKGKNTKINSNTKKGLKKPFSKPIAKTPKRNTIKLKSASQILSNKATHKHYNFKDKNLKNILGNLEIKQKDSVAITVDAPQGAMKTRFVFQIGNEFAGQGLKVLFVSLEEHPTSKLFQDKVTQYVTPLNQNRFYPIGELDNNYNTLKRLIPQFIFY